ncbi:MAG: ABC transporter permease [Acidobacteriota bacterium]
MESFLEDLRYAFRSLGRAPGFVAAVLIILALGIGATSAVFSVVKGLLLSPLPFEQPERLTRVYGTLPNQGFPLSYLDFTDLRERNNVFTELAVHTVPRALNLSADGTPQSVLAEMVSANFFATLGVAPILGRTFTEDEAARGAPRRVAVLSHSFWERGFGKDPAILGKTVQLNDETYELVGVLPVWFRGVTDKADMWLPITLGAEIYNQYYIEDRGLRWLSAIGRLAPGVSLEQAHQSIESIGLALQQEWPDSNTSHGASVTDLTESWFGSLRAPLWTLQASSLLVLLIICTNIANLMLARALRRERDVAVRTALGAPRRRLVQQFLCESILLALTGSLIGLLLATFGTRALAELGALQLHSFVEIRLDATVVLATIFVALLCGLGFGLAPVFFSFRINLASTLKESGRGGVGAGHGRLRKVLIIAEVALAVVLVIGAGLVTKSFQKLTSSELGFAPDRLLTMQMDLLGHSYVEETDRWLLARRFLDELASVSGIDSFALSSPGGAPTSELMGRYFTIEERVRPDPSEDTLLLPYHAVTPGYFETLGATLLEGRGFESQDIDGALKVMVVTRSAAEAYWPGESPIGKRVLAGWRDSAESLPEDERTLVPSLRPTAPWYTVVGMVADVAYEGRTRSPEFDTPVHIFVPLLQMAPASPPRMHLLARADGVSPGNLIGPLRQALKQVAPSLPLHGFATVQGLLDDQSSRDRFLVLLMTLFALIALILAVVGIYAVIAYNVQQQSREIGLRMALGANAAAILKLLSSQALKMVAAGLVLGLLAALALGRYLESILFGVVPSDPFILVSTVVFFLIVTLLAIYVPLRSALRINPATTLQAE